MATLLPAESTLITPPGSLTSSLLFPRAGMDEDFDELHPAVRGLKTVCRCNNIKYRTIERAILQGARSIREIAIRTSATTGHCGGSCTPDVQKMLEKLLQEAPPAEPAAVAAADPDAWWVRKK